MHVSPPDAIANSLFVVGVTSAVGGIKYIRKQMVDLKTALVFAIPSIISVFITRKFLVAAIPDTVMLMSSYSVSRNIFIMLLFSLVMIIAAYRMIRNTVIKEPAVSEVRKYNYPWLILVGFVSGALTGFLGVGGGFIIIPALVLFAKIPVKMSVGTSLLIIAFNSLSGYTEEILKNHTSVDYEFLLKFCLLSIAGIFIGFRISMNMQPSLLKKIFGWFILVMGVCILVKEIYFRM